MYRLLFIIVLVQIGDKVSAQQPEIDKSNFPLPLILTSQEDHAQMMEQLGINELRQRAGGHESAPNHANYDESIANPCPKLSELQALNKGGKVNSVEMWWQERRPEIVEVVEREMYGRIPKNVPDVPVTLVFPMII